jgi:hypothetical protein
LLLYNQCRETFERHQMLESRAEATHQMCVCLLRLNRSREAYELAAEVVAFFRATSAQRDNLARALMRQASAAILMRRHQEADELLREASDWHVCAGQTSIMPMESWKRACAR